ncbi:MULTISPECIES: DUF6508 domain-containing protein [unclassified Pseudomonas]|uniref:DUF6508 domain-containing protein n=1 Tax=unclassified Pseudomonas TaxID=196821 RepID=UPI000D331ECC|nr:MULTISPECIES: DUF6508 domain-containing protein [unclassified Pseudomonas]RAU47862.1 hypothetical protein DBP26_004705 [Pseudomonas sp. RIT 409]RAU55444.1 hypothetical protein DBY65_005960 [Pseudomonas sp. RIT 412]
MEQNLSWLPAYEAPQPLNEPPPGCPPLGRKYEALRSRYLAFVGHAQKYYPQVLTDECRQQGHELARALHSKALDLSSSKATTDSLDIYWFMQCAALVSLFAHGAHSVAFSRYRKDVDYYKDHNLTRQQVEAFDGYVRAFTPELPSGNLLLMRGPQDARSPREPVLQVEDMDELLSFLPRLYPGGIAIKTYTVREGTYWPEYAEVVTDFFCAVGKDCWTDFDYLNHGAAVMIENPACIAQASLADIQSMLTWCARGERFCDGHHGSVIEKGYVLNVLRRIEVLRAAMR